MICLGKTPAFPDFGRAPCCRLHLSRAAKDRSDVFNWFAEHAGFALYTIASQQAPGLRSLQESGLFTNCSLYVHYTLVTFEAINGPDGTLNTGTSPSARRARDVPRQSPRLS